MNKFVYLYIVQGNYRYGWEDVSASESISDAENDLQSYRANAPEYPYRLITRRELNPKFER